MTNTEGSFGTVQYSQIGKAVQSGNVEPEKARTWELGTRYDDGALTAEMGLFLINFTISTTPTRPTTPSLHVAKRAIPGWKRRHVTIWVR